MSTHHALVLLCTFVVSAPAATQDKVPAIDKKTAGFDKHAGFFTFYRDARASKLWLEIPRFGDDFLYVSWLATGLGSNPVGLDRGKAGRERVVRFVRSGSKVLLVQRNLRHRARTDNADERRAVAESFAESVLWGGKVAAEQGGRVLVDFTDFVVRDAQGVRATLRASNEGDYSLDRARSAVWDRGCKAFPRNTELEALLTFTTRRPGRRVGQHAPDGTAVALRERHSLVELPGPGYEPRVFDPRCGAFSVAFADYAAALDAPIEQRWITRHRLEKGKPITYWLDRGAPEPVRGALLEGARWWSQAFAAAGFENAFRVELLPEGADPLDVRYNVIQWVHRSTRGWSYGRSITDPRTGEIIKGHVSLGSLRVRQDRLIFEGVSSPDGRGCAAACGPDAASLALIARADPTEVALARIRQLAAHEVGHTLGFAHNFAASTNDRASVMDYPAPLVKLTEAGVIDLSDAYAVGVGEWDKIAVRYAYTQWPDAASERKGLAAILDEAKTRGLVFVTDQDARSIETANARASLWDNGKDPIAELKRLCEVRRVTLSRFGPKLLRVGQPESDLEALLVPVYLQHRYQVEACAKLLGGASFEYAVRGDGRKPWRAVPPVRQRRALDALLATVQPEFLMLPKRVLDSLAPPHFGRNRNAERFPRKTGAMFDEVEAAKSAADVTLAALLHPQRAARLVAQRARDERLPGFAEVCNAVLGATWKKPAPNSKGRHAAIRRAVERLVLDRLLALAANPNATRDVQAIAIGSLIYGLQPGARPPSMVEEWHQAQAREAVQRFRTRPHTAALRPASPSTPPGSPIGR